MKRIVSFLIIGLVALSLAAQTRKVQNRPYIDQRLWHYGFLAGIHMQDLKFVNNGFITEDGESWFADVAEYSPGFSVGVLGELYLNHYMAVRFIPSLYFGDKRVQFREIETGEKHSQNIRSAYVGVPIDVKFSAERFNNYRPYVMLGIAPMVDLTVKKGKPIRVKPFDCYIEVGMGCDIYLPFFKLIPELKFGFGLDLKSMKPFESGNPYIFTATMKYVIGFQLISIHHSEFCINDKPVTPVPVTETETTTQTEG